MSYHTTSSVNTPTYIASQERKSGKNIIQEFIFNKTSLTAKAQSILLNVKGSKDATFSLTITRTSDNRNYNFETNGFEAAITAKSRAKNLTMGSYSYEIPASSGDTYVFNIHADAHNNTFFADDKLYKKLTITQQPDTSIRFFAVGTGITNTSLGTLTKDNKTKSNKDFSEGLNLKDKQITVTSDITDFGYFIKNASTRDPSIGKWGAKSLFFETTENVVSNAAGDGASGNVITVADTTNLVVGMELKYHKTTTEPASSTTIRDIDFNTKTITFSTNSPFEHGATMTFRAYGPGLIFSSCGVNVFAKDTLLKLEPIETTIRTASTSTISAGGTINVNGMTGIGVGAKVRIRGLNKSINTSETTIASVDNTDGLTQGAITIANADLVGTSTRPIQVNTTVYIDNCSNKIFISGFIGVISFAPTQKDIFLDMDRLLTKGTGS